MSAVPLHDTTSMALGEVLRCHAGERGDAAFILARHGRHMNVYSYADALEAAAAIAQALQRCGVVPGDRVHVHLGNDEWPILALFGAAMVGACVVPTDPRSGSDDLAFVLAHSGSVASITDGVGVAAITSAAPMAPSLRHVLLVPHAKRPTGPGLGLPVSVIAETTSAPLRAIDVDPLSPAVVMYTSGTTGWPKGVLISHANIGFAGMCMAAQLRMRAEDRWLATMPFSHANLLLFSLSSTLNTGASIAVDRFQPDTWLDSVRRYGATLSSLFGGHIRTLSAQWSEAEPARTRLRAVIYAASAGQRAIDTFERVTGAPTVQLYGLTEGIAPALMHELSGNRDDASCGKPTLWSRLQIDATDRFPGAVTGELLIAGVPGRTLMLGYLNDPQASAASLRDGWLHTGDIVEVDPTGYLRFFDRADDLVKPLAENVSTVEIERVLAEHPAVAQTAVLGARQDAMTILKALVVVHPGEAADTEGIEVELTDWCRERLADFKVPDHVSVVDELPTTLLGKVRKSSLG